MSVRQYSPSVATEARQARCRDCFAQYLTWQTVWYAAWDEAWDATW